MAIIIKFLVSCHRPHQFLGSRTNFSLFDYRSCECTISLYRRRHRVTKFKVHALAVHINIVEGRKLLHSCSTGCMGGTVLAAFVSTYNLALTSLTNSNSGCKASLE